MNTDFKLTLDQTAASDLIADSEKRNILLYGGSRSGKTFFLIRVIIIRALLYPGSRHIILRKTLTSIVKSVEMDTFPKVMRICFPSMTYDHNKKMALFTLCNGSEIWLDGLDDEQRVQTILGREYATIYYNEASEIQYEYTVLAASRLALKCVNADGKQMVNKIFYDCNPPTKSHWLYKLFFKHIDPIENTEIKNINNYAVMRLNPDGNRDNLEADYLNITLANMSLRMRKRFMDGEWLDDLDSGLWKRDIIDYSRILPTHKPEFIRIVIGVDPAVTAVKGSDLTGIIAVGKSMDGHCYVLNDASLRGSPNQWAKAVYGEYCRWEADRVIGEVNNGGDLIELNLRTIATNISYKSVKATKGKITRAEPIAALYEQGKVHHVGIFPELEDEMCEYNPETSKKSPDRLDALVWAITELMNINQYSADCF